MMDHAQAQHVAQAVVAALPPADRKRLKAVDVITRLHAGMLTVRLYFYNQVAEDPTPYTFRASELL
jgi:hypothetical protein